MIEQKGKVDHPVNPGGAGGKCLEGGEATIRGLLGIDVYAVHEIYTYPDQTPFTQGSGHLERFLVESSPPPISEDAYRGGRHARWHLAHVDQTSHRRPSAA